MEKIRPKFLNPEGFIFENKEKKDEFDQIPLVIHWPYADVTDKWYDAHKEVLDWHADIY